MAKTIAILGGGIGGVTAALTLRRRLSPDNRVIVIDQSKELRFCPSYTWLIMGWRRPEEIVKDLAALKKKGIEFMNAPVEAIDPIEKKIAVGGSELAYDHMIVSLGAQLAPAMLPGFTEGALNLYELSGVEAVRDALRDFTGGKIVILVSGMPYKCPGAPPETALLIDSLFRRRGIRDRVEIAIYTPEPQPMPVAGPDVGTALKGLLESRDISFNAGLKPQSIDAARKTIVFENGENTVYDLLIGIPPHTAPGVIKNSPLAGEIGWVPVDAATLETKFESCYAIGDVAAIKLKTEGLMLPKAGVFAEEEAKIVANNIAVAVAGEGKLLSFNGRGGCFIDSGFGKAAYGSGDFYADPRPDITAKMPARRWHWAKLWVERQWLRGW